ncbi:MAG TPA: signal recognition particle protein Srp19, partial [Methanoregulaceae archaeon]|nr:signal recognition particle protein Srp19 [Methanoregulaceae archaeon]
SMTSQELDEPSVINSSRMHRIAVGSGAQVEEVRELIRYHKTMQRALKGFRGAGGSRLDMQRIMKRFSGKQ